MGALIARVWFPALLFLASVAFYGLAGSIKAPGLQAGQVAPWFWPRAMLLGLMAACVAKIIEEVGHGWWARPPGGGPATRRDPEPSRIPWLGILLVLGYVLLSDLIGFALATFPFLVAFIFLGGWRRRLPLLVLGGSGTISILYLFLKVVYLSLPKGRGVFEDLTIALYRVLGIF